LLSGFANNQALRIRQQEQPLCASLPQQQKQQQRPYEHLIELDAFMQAGFGVNSIRLCTAIFLIFLPVPGIVAAPDPLGIDLTFSQHNLT
jgi:hypothetical protein